MIIILKGQLIKVVSLYKMSCFPEPYTRSTNKIKVELDLANYAAKSYLKNATWGDTSEYAKTTDLARFQSGVINTSALVKKNGL